MTSNSSSYISYHRRGEESHPTKSGALTAHLVLLTSHSLVSCLPGAAPTTSAQHLYQELVTAERNMAEPFAGLGS